MGTFQQTLNDLKNPQQAFSYRISLIREIEGITGRPLLIYAADFNKTNLPITNSIDWSDKTGFSDLLDGLEGKDIDVFLHSPGGVVEATEQLVNMMREACSSVRFIIANLAKSAATLMALSGDSILMDHRSELGPIDPQIRMPFPNGASSFVPAQTIIDGFNKAREKVATEGPKMIPAYLPLISKYDLHLLEICQNAKDLAVSLAEEWLSTYMFKGDESRKARAKEIAANLANHGNFLSHGRAITIKRARDMGLEVQDLRENSHLALRVWNLYLAIEHFFGHSAHVKMFENSRGIAWGRQSQEQKLVVNLPMTPGPQPAQPVLPPKTRGT